VNFNLGICPFTGADKSHFVLTLFTRARATRAALSNQSLHSVGDFVLFTFIIITSSAALAFDESTMVHHIAKPHKKPLLLRD